MSAPKWTRARPRRCIYLTPRWRQAVSRGHWHLELDAYEAFCGVSLPVETASGGAILEDVPDKLRCRRCLALKDDSRLSLVATRSSEPPAPAEPPTGDA